MKIVIGGGKSLPPIQNHLLIWIHVRYKGLRDSSSIQYILTSILHDSDYFLSWFNLGLL